MPTAIAEARGNPGHRPRKTDPPIAKLRPNMPTMEPAAKKWLDPVMDELEKAGVLTVIDGASLAAMAEAHISRSWWYGELRRMQKAKKRDPLAMMRVQREYRAADDAFRRWASEYGLTAVSRTRLAFKGGKPGDGPSETDDESDLDG